MKPALFFLLISLTLWGAPSALAQEQPTQPTPPEQVLYVCPVHPDVQSKVAGKCPKDGKTLVATTATGQDDAFYACPMHPDEMSVTASKCPRCGMSLVKMSPPEMEEYHVRVETTPASVKPGEKVRLRFLVFHPKNEEQIREFNILHDMPFHLFVISQDLTHFDHIHPEQQQDGSFTIETVLPQAGHYKIFCDFFPKGGTPQVIHRNLVTAGFTGDLLASVPKLTPDKVLTKTVDGIRFELTFDPLEPVAGKPAILKYHLADARSGQPVKDVQPYLGAWGHTLILSDDATDYLHSHPTEMIPEDVDRAKLSGGPEIEFDTFFPRPGHYRIWSQFQRNGKITTVSFTIYVPRLR
jgi:hypothetical protein